MAGVATAQSRQSRFYVHQRPPAMRRPNTPLHQAATAHNHHPTCLELLTLPPSRKSSGVRSGPARCVAARSSSSTSNRTRLSMSPPNSACKFRDRGREV